MTYYFFSSLKRFYICLYRGKEKKGGGLFSALKLLTGEAAAFAIEPPADLREYVWAIKEQPEA